MRGQTSALRLGVTTAALVLLLLLNVRLAAERMRRWLSVLEGYRLSTREGGGERQGRRGLWNMGSFSDPATVERRPGGGGLNSSAKLFEFEKVEDLIQDSSVRAGNASEWSYCGDSDISRRDILRAIHRLVRLLREAAYRKGAICFRAKR